MSSRCGLEPRRELAPGLRSDTNALFCDDNPFLVDEAGLVYSEGQFGYEFWQRYLNVFASLTVVGRKHALAMRPVKEHLNLSGGPRVSFVFAPNLAGPTRFVRHRAEAVATLTDALSRADAVIVRLPSLLGLLAVPIADRLAKPWAAEVVGCPWDQLWNYGIWQARLLAPIQWTRMRRTVAASCHTLYVTQAFLQRRYPARGTTTAVSNVDIPEPDPAVLHTRLRRIRAPQERTILGLIGSIKHKYKGIGTALEALAQIRESLPPFELRVLGPGDPAPWREQARRHGLADQVRFCGVLPSGQPVLEWLDAVDVYLQPSFQEGLPRALIEAMSRACPAVGSTAGGIPELLSPHCLHRPGDHADLAELILRAANDIAWRCAQAERNFDTAKQYTREVLQERRTEFWKEFASYASHVNRTQHPQHARAEAKRPSDV